MDHGTALRTGAQPSARKKTVRDPRLDVFRGIGMLIILVAHIPDNRWALFIPARFGFSDATEMFVFLSGMASAIAFGRLFDREGTLAMTGRVAQRAWQIYWAHVCVFVAIATLSALAGLRPDGSQSYVQYLNLTRFFADPGPQLIGLMTLTYVPNYFDILPMYMVILILMPVMLAAERAWRGLPFLLMALLWSSAQVPIVHFPAEPWSDRHWFFDPFGWQLLFFLGFFLMRGTLPAPRYRPEFMALALTIVLLTIPFAWHVALQANPFLAESARAIAPLTDKTSFGLLRLVHFLALAYVAFHLVGEKGHRLTNPALAPVIALLSKVGQQSLAVFVTGMVLARMLGIALDHLGRDSLTTALANLAGFAILVATAYGVAWFKSPPWKS